MKLLLVMLIGMSFWIYAKPHNDIHSRFPASEDDGVPGSEQYYDEETDIYDSYKMEKDKSAPQRPDQQSKELKQQNPIKLKKKKKTTNDPIGDDVEWSKNTEQYKQNMKLVLCMSGKAEACLEAGKSMLETDRYKATKLIAKACNLRNFTACEESGKLIRELRGADAAIAYFKSACDNASTAYGCFETAAYLEGSGQASADKISNYYRIACFEGNKQSCERLGINVVAN